MAYDYKIEPLNGVDEFTPLGGWKAYGPGVVIPVLNIEMRVTVSLPIAFPMSGNWMKVVQCDSIDTPVTAPHEELCLVFSNLDGATCPKEFTALILPTKPCLRVVINAPGPANWGLVVAKAAYDVMTEQAYNFLMEGRSQMDKELVKLARQASQLQEKLTQGEAEEAEIQAAYTIYNNLLSKEIAIYEALNS